MVLNSAEALVFSVAGKLMCEALFPSRQVADAADSSPAGRLPGSPVIVSDVVPQDTSLLCALIHSLLRVM